MIECPCNSQIFVSCGNAAFTNWSVADSPSSRSQAIGDIDAHIEETAFVISAVRRINRRTALENA